MTQYFKNFAVDESGAVTVDWVVLTAGIVAFGIMVMAIVRPATGVMTTKIETVLHKDIITAF